MSRQDIATAARVVVKVGSSSLTTAAGDIADDRISQLAQAIAERHQNGTQLILVSSGAIASGMSPLGLTRRRHITSGGDGSTAGRTPSPAPDRRAPKSSTASISASMSQMSVR